MEFLPELSVSEITSYVTLLISLIGAIFLIR
jgi:hypothetical protein